VTLNDDFRVPELTEYQKDLADLANAARTARELSRRLPRYLAIMSVVAAVLASVITLIGQSFLDNPSQQGVSEIRGVVRAIGSDLEEVIKQHDKLERKERETAAKSRREIQQRLNVLLEAIRALYIALGIDTSELPSSVGEGERSSQDANQTSRDPTQRPMQQPSDRPSENPTRDPDPDPTKTDDPKPPDCIATVGELCIDALDVLPTVLSILF
jgi:hypothetical protein